MGIFKKKNPFIKIKKGKNLLDCFAFPFFAISQPKTFFSSKKYIFIISHMRSYSSLLSHILGSNIDISGYSEIQQSYKSSFDILKLRYIVFRHNNNILKSKFILDKILHNSHVISEKFIKSHNCYFVFLVRKPESTIKSIINMGYITNTAEFTNPNHAAEYYIQRLQIISRYASILENRFFFIKSENLIEHSNSVLDELSGWLNLREKLKPEYSIFKKTGSIGHGDPSENIKSGKILNKKNNYDSLKISQNILDMAQKKYNHYIKQF